MEPTKTITLLIMSPNGLVKLEVNLHDFERTWTAQEVKDMLHKQHGYDIPDLRVQTGDDGPTSIHAMFLTIGDEHDHMRELPFNHDRFVGSSTLDVAVDSANIDELVRFGPERKRTILRRALADPRSVEVSIPSSGVYKMESPSSTENSTLYVSVQEFKSAHVWDPTFFELRTEMKLLRFFPLRVARLAWACPETDRLLAEFRPTQPHNYAWTTLFTLEAAVLLEDNTRVTQRENHRPDPVWMSHPHSEGHHIPGIMIQYKYSETGTLASITSTQINHETGFTFGGSLVGREVQSKSGAPEHDAAPANKRLRL